MILNYSFLQQLQYFQAQIPRELLEGEYQRIFEICVANQSVPSALATLLAYTNCYHHSFIRTDIAHRTATFFTLFIIR